MYYCDIERLGLKESDFDKYFQAKATCCAVIVDTSHEPNGAIVGVKQINKLALIETCRSGFLHFVGGGLNVCNVRFRVDQIRYSPPACEDSFVISGHVDAEDWHGKTPDLRSYEDIGYQKPPRIEPFDDQWGHH